MICARIYRIQPWEFWLSILCTVGVAVFGAIPGIGFAIVIAVIEFLWDGWRPHSAVLGVPTGSRAITTSSAIPTHGRMPGLVLFRWDAPLFFANAEFFSERVLDAIAAHRRRFAGSSSRPSPSPAWTSLLQMLWPSSTQTLSRAGIELCFAELKDPVKDKLKRFGLLEPLRRKPLFRDDRRRSARLSIPAKFKAPHCSHVIRARRQQSLSSIADEQGQCRAPISLPPPHFRKPRRQLNRTTASSRSFPPATAAGTC